MTSFPERMFAVTGEGLLALRTLVDDALLAAGEGLSSKNGPLPAGGPDEVRRQARDLMSVVLPEVGLGDSQALLPLARMFGWGSVDLTHPAAVALLQCPALTVAAAADAVTGALNQSIDVWEDGPTSIEVEEALIAQLRSLVGLPETASGVMTPGGSFSNLYAVMLARDVVGSRLSGVDIGRRGIAAVPGKLRVVCSSEAHFSVCRALAAAGLGDEALLSVPSTDGRMRAEDVRAALASLPEGDIPFALFATAGTTNLGAIDPLPELAAIARERGIWFHVDAAYGGGALFSSRLRSLLDGIELADSVSLDLHKLAWQPVSSSVLLLRDAKDFAPFAREVTYLNPADDEHDGFPNAVGRTLATTRRADAFKAVAAFRSLGRNGMAALVDQCHDLARHAQNVVTGHHQLELFAPVILTSLLFRYMPSDPSRANEINIALRRRLLNDGSVAIGRANRVVDGETQVHLRFTAINPMASPSEIRMVVEAVVQAGRAEENLGSPTLPPHREGGQNDLRELHHLVRVARTHAG